MFAAWAVLILGADRVRTVTMSETSRLHEVRTALSVASCRTERLIRSLAGTDVPIEGSTWTVREAAIHVAMVGFRYAGMIRGEPNQYPALDAQACARLNARINAAIPESDPGRLAELVHESTASLLTCAAPCTDTHEVLFHAGKLITAPRLLGAALAEHLVHGHDMALAIGHPWSVDTHHAALALLGSGPGYGFGCPSASQLRERNMQ